MGFFLALGLKVCDVDAGQGSGEQGGTEAENCLPVFLEAHLMAAHDAVEDAARELVAALRRLGVVVPMPKNAVESPAS